MYTLTCESDHEGSTTCSLSVVCYASDGRGDCGGESSTAPIQRIIPATKKLFGVKRPQDLAATVHRTSIDVKIDVCFYEISQYKRFIQSKPVDASFLRLQWQFAQHHYWIIPTTDIYVFDASSANFASVFLDIICYRLLSGSIPSTTIVTAAQLSAEHLIHIMAVYADVFDMETNAGIDVNGDYAHDVNCIHESWLDRGELVAIFVSPAEKLLPKRLNGARREVVLWDQFRSILAAWKILPSHEHLCICTEKYPDQSLLKPSDISNVVDGKNGDVASVSLAIIRYRSLSRSVPSTSIFTAAQLLENIVNVLVDDTVNDGAHVVVAIKQSGLDGEKFPSAVVASADKLIQNLQRSKI